MVAVAALVGAAPVRWLANGWPPTGAVVVACDIGQGDALVLPDADGSAVVVGVEMGENHNVDRGDAEPAQAAVDEPAAGAARVRATALAATVPVVEVGPGWTWHNGDIELTALGPTRTVTGSRSDPNNNSLVLLARVRGISILLTGDAEVEEQADLVHDAGPAALRVDVLKVAHHGSSYQDTALLAATGARVALVSAGADNPYGHPNPALLAQLRALGMRILRTDQHGDVAVVLTGSGLGVVARSGQV